TSSNLEVPFRVRLADCNAPLEKIEARVERHIGALGAGQAQAQQEQENIRERLEQMQLKAEELEHFQGRVKRRAAKMEKRIRAEKLSQTVEVEGQKGRLARLREYGKHVQQRNTAKLKRSTRPSKGGNTKMPCHLNTERLPAGDLRESHCEQPLHQGTLAQPLPKVAVIREVPKISEEQLQELTMQRQATASKQKKTSSAARKSNNRSHALAVRGCFNQHYSPAATFMQLCAEQLGRLFAADILGECTSQLPVAYLSHQVS
ncbi:unnamed protein product, partial [Ostreobium quekettii]